MLCEASDHRFLGEQMQFFNGDPLWPKNYFQQHQLIVKINVESHARWH